MAILWTISDPSGLQGLNHQFHERFEYKYKPPVSKLHRDGVVVLLISP